jgi:hypothetical protein
LNSIKQAYRDFLNTPEGAALYRQFKRLLYARDDSLVQWLNPSVVQTLPAAQSMHVRVCDIGGGDGDRITRILQFLHAKFKNRFQLDFIEQSALYVAAFNPTPLTKFCQTRKHHALFENVALPTQTYDVVLLIHSIFAFENGKSTEKVLALRKVDGNIVVVSNAPNSFLGGLKRLVDYGYEDKRFEIDDLKNTLRKLGIDYRQYRARTEWAIEKKTWKHDLGIILNWISLGRYSSLPKRRQSEIEDYIRNRGKKNGSRTLFREEEIILVIPKNAARFRNAS